MFLDSILNIYYLIPILKIHLNRIFIDLIFLSYLFFQYRQNFQFHLLYFLNYHFLKDPDLVNEDLKSC